MGEASQEHDLIWLEVLDPYHKLSLPGHNHRRRVKSDSRKHQRWV